MATKRVSYTTREARDADYEQAKIFGIKGVTRYTTHVGNNPNVVYILATPVPPFGSSGIEMINEAEEVLAQNEPKVLLSEPPLQEILVEATEKPFRGKVDLPNITD